MKHSGRAFLEAGLAFPAILGSVPELAAAETSAKVSSQDSFLGPWVEIHCKNLHHKVAVGGHESRVTNRQSRVMGQE